MSTANLPTEGQANDYVIVLNGDPLEWWDAGGHGDRDGYVMGRGELYGEEVRVTVSYGLGGVSGVSLYFPETDEDHSLTHESHKTHRYLEFYADEVPGVSACVEILPETEVTASKKTGKGDA